MSLRNKIKELFKKENGKSLFKDLEKTCKKYENCMTNYEIHETLSKIGYDYYCKYQKDLFKREKF